MAIEAALQEDAIEEREPVQITHSIQVERAPSPAMSQGEDCAVGGGGTVPVITAFVEGDVAALDTAFQDQTAEQAQEDCGVSLPPAVDQQQHQDDPAQPGLEAPATSSDAEPAMRLENLRRFESLCSALLRPVNGSRLPVLSAGATCAELAHALREQLGPAVLGDVEDGRDAWQRLADLLAAASGVPVTATLAEKFFPPRLDRPHIPKDVPDYVALHTAGLFPSTWQLPLDPQQVQAANSRQCAARQRKGEAVVGSQLSHFWECEDQWYQAEVESYCQRSGLYTLRYSDGEEKLLNLSQEALVHLEDPPLKQPAAEQWPRQVGKKRKGNPTALRSLLAGLQRQQPQQPPPQQQQQQPVTARPLAEQRQSPAAGNLADSAMLPLPPFTKTTNSDMLRNLVSAFKRVVPNTSSSTLDVKLTSNNKDNTRRLVKWLGEAPELGKETSLAGRRAAFEYLHSLFKWSAPALGDDVDRIVHGIDTSSPSVDLRALHAAGCFPHTWKVPLTLDAVRQAHKEVAAAAAADPQLMLSTALEAHMAQVRGWSPAGQPKKKTAQPKKKKKKKSKSTATKQQLEPQQQLAAAHGSSDAVRQQQLLPPSVSAALAAAAALEPNIKLRGVRPATVGSKQRWSATFKIANESVSFPGKTRQQAAVAVDIVATWNFINNKNPELDPDMLNIRGVEPPYWEDEKLLALLRAAETADQVKRVLCGLLGDDVSKEDHRREEVARAEPGGGARGRRRRKEMQRSSGQATRSDSGGASLGYASQEDEGEEQELCQGPSKRPRRVLQAAQQQRQQQQQQQQQQRPLPQALPGGLAELVCAKEQEFEDQAKAAFAAAGSGVPGDLLRPLKLLVLAERGGPVLQQLVEEWATHSPAQQQAAYAAVLIACAKGTWTQLEKRLHYALELAA